jgi:ribonuclease Z
LVTNDNRGAHRIVVLGSGTALASASQDNTFFVVENGADGLLIDCGGSPFHKLLKAGVEPNRLDWVILTHAHPDHIYGLPSLVHELWLDGRRAPLHVFANRHTRQVAVALLDAFDLRRKPMPVEFHLIPSKEQYLLTENERLVVHTSPVKHEVPTVAVRITARVTGRAAVFSADTSPCPELVSLARGADVLFQECTVEEPHPFHSTPRQVGEVAAEAGVGEVILVHYHPNLVKEPYLTIAEIGKRYPGPVRFAEDFDVYEL